MALGSTTAAAVRPAIPSSRQPSGLDGRCEWVAGFIGRGLWSGAARHPRRQRPMRRWYAASQRSPSVGLDSFDAGASKLSFRLLSG